MNKNLNDAMFAVRKADALMYAIERSFLEFEVMEEERERYERGEYTFYALWDMIHEAEAALEKLDGDRRVVDVIYAVNDVRKGNGTLKEE